MGRGMGMNAGGIWPTAPGPSGIGGGGTGEQTPADEVQALRAQAEALGNYLEQIRQRIEELEKGGGK